MGILRKVTGVVVVVGSVMTWRFLSGLVLVSPQGAGAGVIIASGVMILSHIWPAIVTVAGLSLVLFVSYAGRIGRSLALDDLATDLAQLQLDRERLRERINEASAAITAKTLQVERDRLQGEDDLRRARAAVDCDRQLLEERQAYLERIEGELKGARDHIKRLKKKMSKPK